MHYNGTEYPNPQWNGELTLREAFQTSCIWYFRQIIDAVGQEEVKKELDELSYGNGNVSQWDGSGTNPYEELNGFWLDSSLKISPLEQVRALARIFEGQSIYSGEDIGIVKNVMSLGEDGAQKVYGKTGSGAGGEAWFVGFTETEGQRSYFLVFLQDRSKAEQISGQTAKEIALSILGSDPF